MAQSTTMQGALRAEMGPDGLSEGPAQVDRQGRTRLRALVDEYFDFAWRSLRRLGVPESAVDDATQEVFMVVERRLASVRPDRERSFVFGTAVRIASEYRRADRREQERRTGQDGDTLVDPMPSADELLDQKRARAWLDHLLDRLPLQLRTVLILAEGEGLTMAEIATVCALPQGTVASRLRRAREAFDLELDLLRLNRRSAREPR
jgi:RNA polymerase sigma-70 factor (ECF subfamily)